MSMKIVLINKFKNTKYHVSSKFNHRKKQHRYHQHIHTGLQRAPVFLGGLALHGTDTSVKSGSIKLCVLAKTSSLGDIRGHASVFQMGIKWQLAHIIRRTTFCSLKLV